MNRVLIFMLSFVCVDAFAADANREAHLWASEHCDQIAVYLRGAKPSEAARIEELIRADVAKILSNTVRFFYDEQRTGVLAWAVHGHGRASEMRTFELLREDIQFIAERMEWSLARPQLTGTCP